MSPISPRDIQLLLASTGRLWIMVSNTPHIATSTDYHRLLLYIDVVADILQVNAGTTHNRMCDILHGNPALFTESTNITHLINIQWQLVCLYNIGPQQSRL